MARDPTEFRKRYKTWKELTERYNEAIESILSGHEPGFAQMQPLIEELRKSHEAFMEEGRHCTLEAIRVSRLYSEVTLLTAARWELWFQVRYAIQAHGLSRNGRASSPQSATPLQ
jgi:hypothetical protein